MVVDCKSSTSSPTVLRTSGTVKLSFITTQLNKRKFFVVDDVGHKSKRNKNIRRWHASAQIFIHFFDDFFLLFFCHLVEFCFFLCFRLACRMFAFHRYAITFLWLLFWFLLSVSFARLFVCSTCDSLHFRSSFLFVRYFNKFFCVFRYGFDFVFGFHFTSCNINRQQHSNNITFNTVVRNHRPWSKRLSFRDDHKRNHNIKPSNKDHVPIDQTKKMKTIPEWVKTFDFYVASDQFGIGRWREKGRGHRSYEKKSHARISRPFMQSLLAIRSVWRYAFSVHVQRRRASKGKNQFFDSLFHFASQTFSCRSSCLPTNGISRNTI